MQQDAQDGVPVRALRRIVSMPDGTQATYPNEAIQNNMLLGTVRRIGPTRVTDATLILCDNLSPSSAIAIAGRDHFPQRCEPE